MGNELQVMGLNIAICDDEKMIREQIKELAEKEMPDVCAGLYETGDALLAAGKQFDIVFLDIQMEGTDGIETAKRLRQKDEDTILIFITGIREYVFEAFDVAAFHYLLKLKQFLHSGHPPPFFGLLYPVPHKDMETAFLIKWGVFLHRRKPAQT